MTQPIDLIAGALLDLGARAAGEPVEAEDSAEAFTVLNLVLDQWSNEDFLIVSMTEISATIGGGGTDWTIGVGGTINSTFRPLSITHAFVRVSNIDYPVQVIGLDQYELIGLKQLSGPWPSVLYYNSGTPLGTIKFWPNPSSGEIHLWCEQIFTQFTAINDTVLFPQGYEMALRRCLAYELLPSYGKNADAGLISKYARQAKGLLKATNMSPSPVSKFDGSLVRTGRVDAAWIYSGGFN